MPFSFQCTSDNKGYVDTCHQSNSNDTDDLNDGDTLTPADLMTFAWQIAKGMVRGLLYAYNYRDCPICLQFIMSKLISLMPLFKEIVFLFCFVFVFSLIIYVAVIKMSLSYFA